MRGGTVIKLFNIFCPTEIKYYSMVICVIGEGAPGKTKIPECDLVVFGFGGLGEVDYEKELKGETDKFEDACRLSKKLDLTLVCGCKTISRGLVRKSVAVADRGKLLGISDMNHVLDGESFKSGVGLGFYRAGNCKIGLCVENDLLFPDTFKALSLCGCNAVVAILEELKDNMPPLLIRAYSYLYGVPVVMCAGRTAYFADVSGAIATSVQGVNMFEVNPRSRYRVVTTRTRGISDEIRTDY